MERTEISSLGEFGLIERLHQKFGNLRRSDSALGIGDDAAQIDPQGKQVLVSTDLLAEGVHFNLAYTPLRHLGYKAVVVNLSDIAAMNGVPTQIVVGLGLSNRFSVEAVEELYSGIAQACEQYNVDLVGGDITSSRAGLVISVTAIGQADANKIVKRSGAKQGQVVAVTGDFGAAYMGLQLLEREHQVFLANPEMQPQWAEEHQYPLERQLKPEARTDVIHELAAHGVIPTAMIDVSDGLASELLHIAKASNVGLQIFQREIPVENPTKITCSEFGLSPTTAALNGGEDYELLMVLTQSDFEKIQKLDLVIPIGITREPSEGNYLFTESGEKIAITAQGFKHF